MRKFRCFVITLFLVLNNTISVLLVLRDNLFALIQSRAHFKSLLMYSVVSYSLAKWLTELFSTAWWRSLKNIIKRRGAKTDACGIPYSTRLSSDMIPLWQVCCFLFVKYDLNQMLLTLLIHSVPAFLRGCCG